MPKRGRKPDEMIIEFTDEPVANPERARRLMGDVLCDLFLKPYLRKRQEEFVAAQKARQEVVA